MIFPEEKTAEFTECVCYEAMIFCFKDVPNTSTKGDVFVIPNFVLTMVSEIKPYVHFCDLRGNPLMT